MINNTPLKFAEITEKVIGCAMRVHTSLGSGFSEIIYHRSLKIELESIQLNFKREVELPVFYKNSFVGSRRVDFLVDDKVLVEIKALPELDKYSHTQIINYLKAYNIEVGLLINFGESSLKFKRFVHNINHGTLVNEEIS